MPAAHCSYQIVPVALTVCTVLLSGCERESSRTVEGRVESQNTSLHLHNLAGGLTDPFQATNVAATVLVFVATDCPISNRYAPEVQRLHSEFSPRGVAFWLVYPERDTSAEAIQKHLKDYGYSMAALRDPDQSLVKRAGAKVTPEAVVFDRNRQIVYRGRIDDRYVDFGKERAAPTRRDLQEALSALLAGRPVPVSTTRAIGCYIAD